MKDKQTVDFGYQQVDVEDKEKKVAEIFKSVASQYDLMNDLMSGGVHRLWKRFTVSSAALRKGQSVLDIAGGTGDLALQMSKQVGSEGQVVLADINEHMLIEGRDKLIDQGVNQVIYVQANAEQLPFAENTFDCVTIAFGLRNVTNKQMALNDMFRVLKSGGCLLVLEFSKPALPIIDKLYDQYSFNVLPKLGEWVVGDAQSYQYLAESIRMHPDQKTLLSMIKSSGYRYCDYSNMSAGIVALHRGFKP